MNKMKLYPEAKKIAALLSRIPVLVERMKARGLCPDGIDWFSAELVSGLSEKDWYLWEDGHRIAENTDGQYYVCQWTGYCEDDYHGYLYFKTDVPGQFVKVYYEC